MLHLVAFTKASLTSTCVQNTILIGRDRSLGQTSRYSHFHLLGYCFSTLRNSWPATNGIVAVVIAANGIDRALACNAYSHHWVGLGWKAYNGLCKMRLNNSTRLLAQHITKFMFKDISLRSQNLATYQTSDWNCYIQDIRKGILFRQTETFTSNNG